MTYLDLGHTLFEHVALHSDHESSGVELVLDFTALESAAG